MAADEIFAPLFSCLTQPSEHGGAAVNLSAAVGIALFPTRGANDEQLIARAEAAFDTALEKRKKVTAFTPVIWNPARPSGRAGRPGCFAPSRRVISRCVTASRSNAERSARRSFTRFPPSAIRSAAVPLSEYAPLIGEAGLANKVFE